MINIKYYALVGESVPSIAIEKLKKHPYILDVIIIPRDKKIESSISTHPDTILSVFNNWLICDYHYYLENQKLIDELIDKTGLQLKLDDSKRSGIYPLDIGFNALTIEKQVIAKKDSISKYLRDYTLDTKQGYASCSAINISNTIITSDKSIIRTCISNSIDYYEISGKDIILEGYNTGFVGGASGFIKDTLFLFGDSGQSFSELEKYCESKNITIYSICDDYLHDYGGIKFVEPLYK